MNKLALVIPLYNQKKYITQCMTSILSQSLDFAQIIIVDDGSIDGGSLICDELAKTDGRITVIHQENKGLAEARYAGIGNCKSEYITFVDADDFILPNAYDDAVEYMDEGYDQIVYEISRYHDENNVRHEYHSFEPGIYDKKRIIREIYPKLMWDFERNTPGIECSQCIRIVKTELLRKAYKRLEGNRFYNGEDWAITLPLMLKIEKMAVIPRSYYMHRQKENNAAPDYIVSSGYFDEVERLFRYLRRVINEDNTYNFNRQLDYLYIYAIDQKKWAYDDYEYRRDFLFPFDKVQVGKKVILYGAGEVGKTYYKQLKKINYCSEILWVDQNANKIKNPAVKPVEELDKDSAHDYDDIVVAIENKNVALKVREFLIEKKFDSDCIII